MNSLRSTRSLVTIHNNPLYEVGSAPHWEVQQDSRLGYKMVKKIVWISDDYGFEASSIMILFVAAGSQVIEIPIHIDAPQRSKSVRITRIRDQANSNQRLRSVSSFLPVEHMFYNRVFKSKYEIQRCPPPPHPLKLTPKRQKRSV